MKHNDLVLLCLLLLSILPTTWLFADIDPNGGSCIINDEFSETIYEAAPLHIWAQAGSNVELDTLAIREIDITQIEPKVSFPPNSSTMDTTSFVSANPDDDIDDSGCFKALLGFIALRKLNLSEHIRILIPPGIYNFSDQIIMHSNISLKGAGSHLTTLRFLIRADSNSTTMSKADCRKDAILISGSDDAYKYNCGIEDLKIERIRNGISEGEVKDIVGRHTYQV